MLIRYFLQTCTFKDCFATISLNFSLLFTISTCYSFVVCFAYHIWQPFYIDEREIERVHEIYLASGCNLQTCSSWSIFDLDKSCHKPFNLLTKNCDNHCWLLNCLHIICSISPTILTQTTEHQLMPRVFCMCWHMLSDKFASSGVEQ